MAAHRKMVENVTPMSHVLLLCGSHRLIGPVQIGLSSELLLEILCVPRFKSKPSLGSLINHS